MKADLTRDSFAPQKNFTRVLMQQGRVQLDADWNEQAAILMAATRRVASQVMAADGSSTGAFALTPIAAAAGGGAADAEIAPGVFWVDGIGCEAAATPVAVLSQTSTSIAVAQWTVDGIAFASGQRVRATLTNSEAAFDPMLITGVDYVSQALSFASVPDESWTPPQAFFDVRRVLTYLTQPDLPYPPPLPAASTTMVLDVWERLVTPLEDDSISEPALGDASTADRARLVWQVKALPDWVTLPEGPLTSRQIAWLLRGGYAGTLRARVQPAPTSTDPCTVMPGSPYRGAENQLYRVEVNTGSLDVDGQPIAPTFKWSRDNGSATFGVRKIQVAANLTTVTLASLGPDERFGLDVGDLVEIADDEATLKQLPGQLLAVQSIDRANRLVVLAGTAAVSGTGRLIGSDTSLHPLMRRWDHGGAVPVGTTLAADGCIPIAQASIQDGAGAWLALEDGIQVLFDKFNPDAKYCPGDYWLLPARVATANLIWPQEAAVDDQGNAVSWPAARLPDGIEHHYASLGAYDPPAKAVVGEHVAKAPARKKAHA